MVIWRSLIHVYHVCNHGPQMTRRPGPKSGARTGKSNKSLDQNNICSLSCEGSGPIRKVRGSHQQEDLSCTIHRLKFAENSYIGERFPTKSCWTVHLVCRSPATCLHVCRSSASCLLFKLVGINFLKSSGSSLCVRTCC